MRIIELVLSGYKHVSLANVDKLVYTPNAKIQLILGTNGSGKSSVLKELSPLPAIANEFYPNGYKQITIIHNNSEYFLCSSFVGKATYSFIKDGVELNPVLGITAFRELVSKEFNYNDKVHELLLGTQRFSSMTVAARREWLTNLSNVDYTYALGYFNRLTRALRDIDGGLRLLQSRLVLANEKLLDSEDIEREKNYITHLKSILEVLYKTSGSINPVANSTLQTNKSTREQTIVTLVRELERTLSTFSPPPTIAHPANFPKVIEATKLHLSSLRTTIDLKVTELGKVKKNKELLDKSNLSSLEDVLGKITVLTKDKELLTKELRLTLSSPLTNQALSVFSHIESDLRDLFSSLTPDKDRSITLGSYNQLNTQYKELTEKIHHNNNLTNALLLEKKELERCREHEATLCPKCNHSWHVGYNEQKYKDTETNLTKLHAAKKSLDTQRVAIEAKQEHYSTQLRIYQSLRQLFNSTPDLKPVWDMIIDKDMIRTSSSELATVTLSLIKQDTVTYHKIDTLSEQIASLEKDQALLKKAQSSDLGELTTIVDTLTKELDELYKLSTKTSNELRELESSYNTYTAMVILCDSLQSAVERSDESYRDLIDSYYLDSINKAITHLKSELTTSENYVSQQDMNRVAVENLQSQIDEYKRKQTVYRIAVKELSPTEGLIAKGLSGFINSFVAQVNTFIERIWLYPLEIQPVLPNEEDGYELNYRFSLLVNDNKENPVADVSRGSSAMREVIDLAFKVVASKYLGLENFPLYLDELAASFDKAHRNQAQRFMLNLANISDFSQVFIISHYEELYGSFQNADINIISQDNIPDVRNGIINKNFLLT